MGVRDTELSNTSRDNMRAYTDRTDRQRAYPWERQKRDGLSSSMESERWNRESMNGPTKGPACKKYVSVVSEGNYFIASKAPLPDRIELRMCGTTGLSQSHRSLSIPDLYRVKMTPVPEPVMEDIVDAVRQEEVHMEPEICPHSNLTRSGSMTEMYVSQYTHHFDPNEPRTHIAGWKVDMEPKGIPHRHSPMCVLNNPMISGSRKRPERPKSAPASLAYEFDTYKDDIEEDLLSYSTLPRFDGRNGLEPSSASNGDLSNRLKELIVDADPVFATDGDGSSFGYDPSDDTSESSSFLQDSNSKRDSANFSYSRPKLIRLSADFPGVRNMEKLRRKRQSMGSASTGSISPTPSPSKGEYGFFVALTSKDQIPQPRKKNSRRPHKSVS